MSQASDVLAVQQIGDGFAELGGGDLVVLDEHALEEPLVEEAANARPRLLVAARTVGGDVEGVLDGPSESLELDFGGGDLLLGVLELARDPGLLLLQQLDRDGALVVGSQQLGPLVAERLDPAPRPARVPLTASAVALELLQHVRAGRLDLLRSQLPAGVLPAELPLDGVGHDVALWAAVAALAAGAEEVEVGPLGVGQEQACGQGTTTWR